MHTPVDIFFVSIVSSYSSGSITSDMYYHRFIDIMSTAEYIASVSERVCGSLIDSFLATTR
jgi:hypothetical protein